MAKKKAAKKEVYKQLPLGLKHSFFNGFKNLQKKFFDWFLVFELHRFAKDLSIWLFFSAMFSLIIYQFAIIVNRFAQLPHILPILQTVTIDKDKLLRTEFIYALPISCAVILILSYVMSYKFYEKNKDLVLYFLLISTITTVVITISLLKIIG